MWRDKFIAVDWGTTNRRAWLIGSDGMIIDRLSDHLGLTSVPQDGFDAEVVEIRQRLGNYPMLLAGMVGSNMGWRLAPYVTAPANVGSIAEQILWINPQTGIIPGVCQTKGHDDVMRGEEVQALGVMVNGVAAADAYICHPGTHTKWIRLCSGRIDQFQTMMTGEIFSLLREHSILQAQLTGEATDGEAFAAGLAEARHATSLLSSLFSIRARFLVGQKSLANASFASGLLIGSDVHAGLAKANAGETVVVVGRTDLCQLYARAIKDAGFDSEIVDGETSFLAGVRCIIQNLRTE